MLRTESGQGQAQILLDTSLRGSPSPWPAEASREALKCQRGAGAEVSVGAAILREGSELGSWPPAGRLHPGRAPTLSIWAVAWTWDLEFGEAAGAPASSNSLSQRGPRSSGS